LTSFGIGVALPKSIGAEIGACHLFIDAQIESQADDNGEKMSLAKFASWLSIIFLLAGCDLVSMQYQSGPAPYSVPQPGITSGAQASSLPQSVTQPQSQPTGSQNGQYIWDQALQGMIMGASLAGPYGAGGGLIIGLLAGLFTADAHYAQLNTQIQSEQAKNRELEAKIEQEMQRQRELEPQLENSAANSIPQNQAEPPQSAQKPNGPKVTTIAMKEPSSTVASLSKIESPSNSASRPFKNVEVRDINGDGIPDLWIYYNPLKSSEIMRQEEATHGDGRVDTWSYFKDGKLVRREVDSKGREQLTRFTITRTTRLSGKSVMKMVLGMSVSVRSIKMVAAPR
jgi:hypothetical protein